MPIDALPSPLPDLGADIPSGVATKAVIFGASGFDFGPAHGFVTVTAPKNVIHLPTGRRFISGDMRRTITDGVATFAELCPNDQPGLNRYDWTYRVKFEIRGAVEQPEPFDFLISTADPDVIDGDRMTPVPSSIGTPVSVDIGALIVTVLDDPNSALYTRIRTLAGFGQGNP